MVQTKNEKSWKFETSRLDDLKKDLRTDVDVSGPWDDEPDKIQWIDLVTDLDCLIVRNRMGGLCGYVGVAPDHPLHGKHYSDCLREDCTDEFCYGHSPESELVVHGGLTFSNRCADGDPVEGICHIPEPGRPHDVWWFGFDCGHHMDMQPQDLILAAVRNFQYPFTDPRTDPFRTTYRDVEYVKGQCVLLAAQLAVLDNE